MPMSRGGVAVRSAHYDRAAASSDTGRAWSPPGRRERESAGPGRGGIREEDICEAIKVEIRKRN
jgi:hypothetical protein